MGHCKGLIGAHACYLSTVLRREWEGCGTGAANDSRVCATWFNDLADQAVELGQVNLGRATRSPHDRDISERSGNGVGAPQDRDIPERSGNGVGAPHDADLFLWGGKTEQTVEAQGCEGDHSHQYDSRR